METFLFWVGWYNLLGFPIMIAMQSDAVGDLVLRRATEIASTQFSHGPWSRMWLWWATATNLFLGGVMVRASAWPASIQREVVVGALAVYVLMFVVLVAGGRGANFGRGVWITSGLWLAQIAWGVWALQ